VLRFVGVGLVQGGKSILAGIEQVLGLQRWQTECSWEVLKNYGNMVRRVLYCARVVLRVYGGACAFVSDTRVTVERHVPVRARRAPEEEAD
jgi:hypothetical protein